MISTQGNLLNYSVIQGQGVPIVLMHGWGGSSQSFVFLEKDLIDAGHTVVTVDFAGFGQSTQPPSSWGIYEYAQSIKTLLDSLGFDEYHMIGHSFGGRVGIILGKDSRVTKLLLCNAAGIKPRRGPKYRIKVCKHKLKKKLGFDVSKSGSNDYQALSNSMKEVFVRVVNQDLTRHLCDITANTLIVWGNKDRTTPMYMAKKLNKKIVGSGLIVLDSAGHYSYMEHRYKFVAIAKEFFR